MRIKLFLAKPARIVITIILLTQSLLAAQAQVITGGNNYINTVADLDRSIAFYEEAFGLSTQTMFAEPTGVPMIQNLTNTGNGLIRIGTAEIPGANFLLEFTEFSELNRNPGRFNMHDPGSARLLLVVTDIDTMLEAAIAAGATIETTGGEILRRDASDGSYNRAIFLRDLDGFLVELVQRYSATSVMPAMGNPAVIGGGFSITVENLERSIEFWRHFGIDFISTLSGRSDPTSNALAATEGASLYGANVVIQNSDFSWSLFEFNNINRNAFQRNIPDPGAPALSLLINDMDAAMAAIDASGADIVSVDNQAVSIGEGANIFIRDPDGFLIELIKR
ncbi:MAG: hypothetical protein COA71_08235 [SAR86 cluster bacterium]|uniref:VOC domain-containing protein n=1 Tax=SAR86 cluster bacterium TaxID=2030880 RepID=A0A2A5CDE6_9GAMM|nr:MAG: hypothetical protein COA71_08235 [SAR86 cluster bacterium]